MSRVLRGESWRVRLNPTEGDEIQKARPCLIVSSDHVGKLRLRVVVPCGAADRVAGLLSNRALDGSNRPRSRQRSGQSLRC